MAAVTARCKPYKCFTCKESSFEETGGRSVTRSTRKSIMALFYFGQNNPGQGALLLYKLNVIPSLEKRRSASEVARNSPSARLRTQQITTIKKYHAFHT